MVWGTNILGNPENEWKWCIGHLIGKIWENYDSYHGFRASLFPDKPILRKWGKSTHGMGLTNLIQVQGPELPNYMML